MAARELPSGTVTLLFTDIEGSTRLLQELGREAYVQALTDHRRLLRDGFTAYGGVEVETQGDSFHFAFPVARDAVEAAAATQRALAEHAWESEPIRVRIGLHTGEPMQAEGLYAGIDVHRAARVMGAAHGGQVLLSQSTAELVAGDDTIGLLDLGEHRLKDLTAPQRLYQAVVGGLPSEFPPLRTLHVTNLPVQASRLIGRQQELAEITQRFREDEARLLTLTGPGGTGKTRLALQAAADLIELFEGGAYFVPLASIHDPALVLLTVAKSLGLREQPGLTVVELLGEHLGQQRRLLVLDNFEQIVDAAPDIAALLAGAPAVSLLVTSREPLRIGGEQLFAVPALAQDDAVGLFVERARAASHVFEPTDENAAAVAAICTLLDGLPLAIELAAARVGVLSPSEMVERLDHSLDLLTGGRRDVDERHQTLRATIDWSYDLLRDPERQALARASVFPAGFALEDAETVCGAGLDELAALTEQSLIRRDLTADDGIGFRFLRVIREYALEALARSGEADEIKSRHVAWCLDLAQQADAGYRGDEAAVWLARVEARHDDFRAALGWARDAGDYELLMDLADALSVFWQAHGHLTEAAAWFDEIIAHAAEISEARLVSALQEASTFAHRAGDYEREAPLVERQLALSRQVGSQRGVIYALSKLASLASELGDHDRARSLLAEAVSTAREAGDDRALMGALTALGNLELLTEAYGRATPFFDEALELARVVGRRDTIATALFNLGLANVLAGAPEQAAEPLQQSVLLAHELGDREGLAYAFEVLGAVAVAEERHRDGTILLGAADALLEASGASLEAVERALHERTKAEVQSVLADDFEAAWNEGRDMSPDDLVESVVATR